MNRRSTSRPLTRLSLGLVLISLCGTCLAQLNKPITFNTYAPVAFVDETSQEVDGPVAELVKQINKELNQEINFLFTPLPRMFVELEARRSQAAFNMSYNEERAEKWHYSLPVHVVNYGIFVKKDNPLDYRSRSQLEGMTIATYGPTNMSKKVYKFASELSDTTVLIENSYEHVFKMLEADRFDKRGVAYVPDVIGFDTIKKHNLQNVRYAGPDIKNLYYVIFVKDEVSKAYVDAFNQVLQKYHQDGTMARIYSGFTDSVTANVPALEDMKAVPGH